jgi:hypothetical protein
MANPILPKYLSIGQQYNNLTVVAATENGVRPNGQTFRQVVCQCVCGITKVFEAAPIHAGRTKDCGCKKRNGPIPKPAIDRFLPKTIITNIIPEGLTTPCIRWIGYIDKTTGYGKFLFNKRGNDYAHRFAYEYYVGPIPEGLHIDHLCRNRWCVNSEHLEPVTLIENLLRGDRTHLGQYQREKTHCPQGHEFTPENTWFNKTGGRHCKTCNRERMRERRAHNR